ncbi:MAG TPA: hypothetical protein VNO70_05190, partial [Blastocatellia bacterium]|nr:hypothetical protein [Blastocatellia bacterium]
MKSRTMRFTVIRQVVCLTLILAALAAPSLAQQDIRIWTTAASAGTVNDEDKNEVVLTGSIATLSNAAPEQATAIIRYNVVAVDFLLLRGIPGMGIRYRDNGAGAQVIARLWEYDFINGGPPKIAIAFDSDHYPAADQFQTRSIGNCGIFTNLNFATK